MLTHPTFDQLRALKLTGMLKALQEQEQTPDIGCLGFLERVGLLVDREIAERDSRRLADRLRYAKLKQAACLEDLDLHTPRQLDRPLILKLADCQWVADHLNILITGPTGIGTVIPHPPLLKLRISTRIERCHPPIFLALPTITPTRVTRLTITAWWRAWSMSWAWSKKSTP